jgi:polyphosphate:AMP phosphotransferase
MLERIDLSKKLGKKEYKKIEDEFAPKLAALQRECKSQGIPIMIVFEGWGAAGKGTLINQLIQPLDPRGFKVYSIQNANEEERMRPFLWRFWTKTPAKGRMNIFDRSWYRRVSVERMDGITTDLQLQTAFDEIRSFEEQLTDDGTILIKFFLHISKKEQEKRFRALEASKETAWRVTKDDWRRNKEYDKYLMIIEEMIQKTDTDYGPWTIIEATDREFASVKIMTTVIDRLSEAVEEKKSEQVSKRQNKEIKFSGEYRTSMLDDINPTKEMSKEEYKEKLQKLQNKLFYLHSEMYRQRIPAVLAFEGWDAGGKGGAIKRLTQKLDPRGYEVFPTAAPNDIEKAHHYLWRFWNGIPKAGHMAIFDRTWYGRVMVERIEGFCSTDEWQRAYKEINQMEEHIANSGAVVLKFWMHIDKDEQERRFHEREQNPEKQWKITDEDWRNREKWDQYLLAVDEMLVRTSTTYAPWIIVEGNNKYYARIKVLKTVVEALEKKLEERKKTK